MGAESYAERPKRTLNPDERLSYTIAEALEVTGMSRPTIYRLHAAGKITLKKVGRLTIVEVSDIRAMLASAQAVPRRAA